MFYGTDGIWLASIKPLWLGIISMGYIQSVPWIEQATVMDHWPSGADLGMFIKIQVEGSKGKSIGNRIHSDSTL